MRKKLEAIQQVQRDGRISDHWSPATFLLLITSINMMWLFVSPDMEELNKPEISATAHGH